jgi:hypothetical protein
VNLQRTAVTKTRCQDWWKIKRKQNYPDGIKKRVEQRTDVIIERTKRLRIKILF